MSTETNEETLNKETVNEEAVREDEKSPETDPEVKEGEAASEEEAEEPKEEPSEESEEANEDSEKKDDGKAGEAKEKPEGKRLFGKKNKKDPKDEKIEELTDRVKRQLAEFENFRNRSEKEKASMYSMGAKSIIERILPIIDNFERGLEHAPEEGDPFGDGMRMVYKQMLTELESAGVKAIDAVGTDFDPNIHNAVMQVESEEYESGKVAQELQKGYMYKDTLVRPSMVAVVP